MRFNTGHPRRTTAIGATRWHTRRAVRTCATGKVCHESMAEARIAAERAMEAGEVDPGCHVEPFLCSSCHAYHTGNRRIVFRDEAGE